MGNLACEMAKGDGWMDGLTGGWMEGRTAGWTDGHLEIHPLGPLPKKSRETNRLTVYRLPDEPTGKRLDTKTNTEKLTDNLSARQNKLEEGRVLRIRGKLREEMREEVCVSSHR